jgi:adenylate cyclase, class 2
MPVEIEAKMSVDSHEPVRQRLRERGATFRGDFVETNTFFDTEDRALLAADEGLRLRLNRNAGTGESENVVTYKGPRQHGALKARDEVEVNVSDGASASSLLGRLGFGRVLSFEKRRQSWALDGCKVELDEVPFLGTFVEVEGPDEQSVMRVRKSLALDARPIVKTSYIALLMTHLQERGDRRTNITFAEAP